MKKIIVCAIAIMALTFAACGNKQGGSQNAEADSTANALVEGDGGEIEAMASDLKAKLDAKDSKGFSEAVASVKQKIDELVKAGKVEEAKAYASKVKQFVDENAETIKSVANGNETISGIVNTISALPTSAESAVDAAGEAVKSDAENAVKSAKDAAETKATEAKEAVKQKANDAVDKAASKALNKLGL